MQVMIKGCIHKVSHGVKYKGRLEINRVDFHYELEFDPSFAELKLHCEPEKFKENFRVTVKKDGIIIEMNEDELGFFSAMLLGFAARFYTENPDSESAITEGICNFPPKLCVCLSAPKFGCNIVD